jgi:hypothetical protein
VVGVAGWFNAAPSGSMFFACRILFGLRACEQVEEMGSSQSPIGTLIFGMFLLSLAVVYTCIGKVWTRVRWVCRADEPKRYWFELSMYYFWCVFCVWLYFLAISN